MMRISLLIKHLQGSKDILLFSGFAPTGFTRKSAPHLQRSPSTRCQGYEPAPISALPGQRAKKSRSGAQHPGKLQILTRLYRLYNYLAGIIHV
jgi:hypothetical protein